MLSRLHIALLLITILLVAPGCYHATVVTGQQVSDQVVEDRWADSYIAGLVPPETVNVNAQCPGGVAIVETQLSFLNMIVTGITLGLYSPMTIKATCAPGFSTNVMPTPFVELEEIMIPRNATDANINRAFYAAALRAAESGEPIAVRFMK